MQSPYYLEFDSRETVAERLRQAEHDDLVRRARQARERGAGRDPAQRHGWLALPRTLVAVGRRLGRGVTPSAAG